VQLQSRLTRPHGSFETSDLAHACSVGRNGVYVHKADPVRISEEGVVESIERLEAELELDGFGDAEILGRGQVYPPLGRASKNADAGAAVMAKIRPARNVAGHSLEGAGIEPPRARGVVNPPVGDAVGTNGTAGVEVVALGDGERETGAQRN